MASPDFQIHISGGTVSIDDWRRANEAAEADLPALDKAQKEAALKLGMTDAEYARGVLADEIGRKHQQERGKRLGEVIKNLLGRSNQTWELSSLVRKGIDDVWIARFEDAGRASKVEIPLELADDVVDSGDPFSKAKLDRLLTEKLESSAVRKAS
jgi:hypothetical protein